MKAWTLAILVGVTACDAEAPTQAVDSDEAPIDDVAPDMTVSTSGDSDGATSPPPPPLPEDCRSPNQQVVSFSVSPSAPNDDQLPDTSVVAEVTLAEVSTVAVVCQHDTESEEVFFVESEAADTQHTLHLTGLIANSTYTCTAAPVCPFVDGPPTTTTYTTGIPPEGVRRLEVTSIHPVLGVTGAWTLAPLRSSLSTWLVAWDRDGRARWWWPTPSSVFLDIEVLADVGEDTVVWGGGQTGDGRTHVVSMLDGSIVYAYAPPHWDQNNYHHDGKRVEDGRLLTLEGALNTPPGGGFPWEGFRIQLHDQTTGTVSFDYSSQTGVDFGDLSVGSGDAYHANWAEYRITPSGGRVYASLCETRQILSIDETTQEAVWLFGLDLGWTIEDHLGNPLSDDDFPQCQHGLEVDETGDRLLVYDNGNIRAESRASEWVLDPTTLTATRTWNWTEAGWYENILGDIDWITEDRILVTKASLFGTELVEVDRSTRAVANRYNMPTGSMYRSERYFGCDLFSSVAECETRAERYEELRGLFTPAATAR